MTYIPAITANVSSLNSTTTALGSGGVFTGTPEDVSQYASISVAFYVQPVTSTGNVLIQFSNTNSVPNWITLSNTVTAVDLTNAAGFTLDVTTAAQYFRVVYVNDTAAQTKMTIQSIFHPQARIATTTTRYAQIPNDYSDMINTRSMIWGKTIGGNIYEPVATNGENSLVVHIAEPRAAFGELSVAQDTPIDQIDFVYGINTNLSSNSTTNGATVTATNGMLVLTTGAIGSSVATFTSKKYVKYRPGQGTKSRFTAMFTSGVAGSTQIAGILGGTTDGAAFGYNGTSFGVLYRHGGTDTWIPRTSWNFDTLSIGGKSGKVIDPTRLNVYQVKFQYLGGGNVFFYVLNDFDGRWILVHEVKNAGNLTAPVFRNPSMPLGFEARNIANTSAISISTASMAQFLEGARSFLGPKGSIDSANTSVAVTTQSCVIALRNASSYNGIPNYATTHIRQISISANDTGATKGCVNLRVIKNPTTTFGGFTPFNGTGTDGVTITNGQSSISSNLTPLTITGGSVIYTSTVNIGGSSTIDLTPLDLVIYPGEYLCFCAFSTTAGPTVGVSVCWSEDI